jgi:DNA-binding IclR family transcriptional regulator
MPTLPFSSQLRGVVRTLDVLRAVNDAPGAGVSDLAQRTSIPRPSLYRILETLWALGYVRRRRDGEGYAPTIVPRVLQRRRARRDRRPPAALARDARYVSNLVAMTRRRGYGERVVCCLNISFIASALTPAEAAARYLDPLQPAARRIERQLGVASA